MQIHSKDPGAADTARGVDDTAGASPMDERRDPPAEPGSHPAIAGGELPAAQRAHIDYSDHVNGTKTTPRCPRCSDIDRGRCDTGQQLWRDWNAACEEAYRRLNDATH